VLERLAARIPNLRYIHLVRNGLDMAHSGNPLQPRLWGNHFLNQPPEDTPHYFLRYWVQVHRRILPIGESMGENFLLLNYDRLCENPRAGLGELLAFLGEDPTSLLPRFLPLVKRPETIGRFREYGTQPFEPEDIAFVRSMGFDVGD
jgi:hypothetical protein